MKIVMYYKFGGSVKLVASVAGIVALMSGCASEAREPTTFAIEGVLSGQASEWNADGPRSIIENSMNPKRLKKWVGKPCYPADGHSFAGDQVTVRNARDEVVAIGRVSGDAINQMDDLDIDGFGYLYCEFAFRVKGIPKGSAFYSIQVGQRGPVNFSAKELQSGEPIRLG